LIRERYEQASAGVPDIAVGDVLGIGVVHMLILSVKMGKTLYQIKSSFRSPERTLCAVQFAGVLIALLLQPTIKS